MNLFGAVNDMVLTSLAKSRSLTYVEPAAVFFGSTCSRQTHTQFLVEYQGKGTHGKEAIASFGHRNGLRRITHDKIKRDYCKHHRIPLLCISYRESIPTALRYFIKVNKINIMKPKPVVVTKTKPSWPFFAIVLLIVLFGTLAKPDT